jgi:hypothetical protein
VYAVCSNYEPVTRADRLLAFFGVVRELDEALVVVFPTGLAPFVRLAEDGSGNRRVDEGAFGLLPHFATEIAYGRRDLQRVSQARRREAHGHDPHKGLRRLAVVPRR